ncbi:SIN3-HDAC complex-associated factor [Belonocnema kinseyi]|uniref:SIN3-HDAC complex-associated factor n=1 Tax=Belonocnema kinseyi TaxID=2817044 RepID=UPI00143D741E|nr:SIN3-HDAC complex-associated factor [Belonocnema kinseyi]XP_033223149.1 SIN3-HDAC complex-associated factor [Belonocnema kinseyi]XP_033223150.1 SIN3-HDAC complex-associated factor [Belonocnema kinseyi]
MFSFHKPKVYRSSQGCCICKAKSSSSRFTDSKKYEEDFIKCFELSERRTGEICNACVLLVKRWKKLPADTKKNWKHVVDARAGPGIKSLTKFKAKNKKKKLQDEKEKLEKLVKKKHVYLKRDREQSPAMSDDLNDDDFNCSGSKNSSRAGSPLDLICETSIKESLLALAVAYFKQEAICCGMVFKGRNGEVMMDKKQMKPCSVNVVKAQQQQMTVLRKSPSPGSASASPSHSSASTSPAYSMESTVESYSDSGYDENSNGLGERKLTKIIQNSASGVKVQHLKGVQLKAVPIDETVRLKSSQEVPMNLVPMKPISIIAATNLTMSNLTLSDGSSLPIAQSSPMMISSNPLVDLAMHASSRQPV